MASPQQDEHDADQDPEIERYRNAAMLALDQLEWCIDYLYRVRKSSIARALARNRAQIIERGQLSR